MEEHKYAELEERASASAEVDQIKKLEARARILHEIEEMRMEGKAMTLSDEECEMLESFRRFKMRMRKGEEAAVFSWRARRPEGIQLVQDTAEILHPNEGG